MNKSVVINNLRSHWTLKVVPYLLVFLNSFKHRNDRVHQYSDLPSTYMKEIERTEFKSKIFIHFKT